jgi:ABC-type branched-subunit amino acid transport system substrate-binding protein
MPLGKVLVAKGHKKAVFITWKYAAGDEAFEGFKEAFEKGGGKLVKELYLPFPNVEFQALLTEIASDQARRVVASSPAAAPPSSSRTTQPPASRARSRCTAPAS